MAAPNSHLLSPLALDLSSLPHSVWTEKATVKPSAILLGAAAHFSPYELSGAATSATAGNKLPRGFCPEVLLLEGSSHPRVGLNPPLTKLMGTPIC